jgi:hypothetical protein
MEPLLHREAHRDRGGRVLEGDHEGVALGLDLVATELRDGGAKQRVVLVEQRLEALAQVLPERR